jgi:hypothetical protein
LIIGRRLERLNENEKRVLAESLPRHIEMTQTLLDRAADR